jgi:hypothetical protein
MDRFIARANIDHYLDLLNDGHLASEKQAVVVKLLIAEEDKLSRDMEQLQFAEAHAASGRERLSQLRYVRNGQDPIDHARMDRPIANFQITQPLLDDFCPPAANKGELLSALKQES